MHVLTKKKCYSQFFWNILYLVDKIQYQIVSIQIVTINDTLSVHDIDSNFSSTVSRQLLKLDFVFWTPQCGGRAEGGTPPPAEATYFKGIVHNFFYFRSELIFWMRCGIADFGRRA